MEQTAIEMTADREERTVLIRGAATKTRIMSGTPIITRSSVQPHEWVGPTTNESQPDTVTKSKGETP